MRPTCVSTIDAHVAGAPLRLIVGGLPPLPGRTLAEKHEALAGDAGTLARAVLREPRGHADMLGAMLTEPESPAAAAAGVLFFMADDSPRLPSHGVIGVTTIALERRLLTLSRSDAFVVDTLAGPVSVEAVVTRVDDAWRVRQVGYRTSPVFVVEAACPVRLDARLLHVDVAWADGYYVVADREALAVASESGPQDPLRRAAARLIDALAESRSRWTFPPAHDAEIQAVVLTGPPVDPAADLRSTVVYANGAIDRSPSGGGTASVLAVLDAMGLMEEGRLLRHEGPAGLLLEARVSGRTDVAGIPALIPSIAGEAWITGDHAFVFDEDDPLVRGFDV